MNEHSMTLWNADVACAPGLPRAAWVRVSTRFAFARIPNPATRRPSERPRLSIFAAALLFALGARAADAPVLKAGVFDPPRQAPEFSLQGSDGRTLTLSRFRDKVVVLGFGYTSCPDVCPTTLSTLAQMRRKLGAEAADVQIVYVTVDPERDTVERMREYLGNFNSAFIGATGGAEQLAAVRKDYGVQAEKKTFASGYAVAHSSYTYLIDRKGRLRALMPYGRSPDDYVHDLTILLKE
jgi:protein SCO1/2